MRQDAERTSRRAFLGQLGAGTAGVVALGALPLSRAMDDVEVPHEHYAQAGSCAPPTPTGSAVPFRRDCRPIRPRKAAAFLSAGEVTQLKQAYKLMRDLDTSDPSDPRGFTRQRNIHCYHCGSVGPEMHFTWRFFAWHRAYLYFHERILGHLVGDPDFRLPYWGWDSPVQRRIPTPYMDAASALYNNTRAMSATDVVPDEDVNATVMNNVLNLATFAEFGGTNTTWGVPENVPHGPVHVAVGGFTGDMSFFETAANDPVFYAHHANLDKVWSDWIRRSSAHTNPTDPAFLNLTFTFYDERKVWRSIRGADLVDFTNSLRYEYEVPSIRDIIRCFVWFPVSVTWNGRVLALPPASRRILGQAAAPAAETAPVRLHIDRLEVPTDRSAVYRIYAGRAEAEADRGPGSPGYLGTTAVVLNDRANRRPPPAARPVVLDVTRALGSLTGVQGGVELFLVERSRTAEGKRMLPVRARSISMTRGQLERE